MRVSLILAGLLIGCATSAEAPAASWGKAGVTMDAFLADAAYCAASSASVRAETVVLVQGSSGATTAAGGTSEAANASQDAMLNQAEANRRAQIRADTRARQVAHDQCLTDRGYRQFRLNSTQRAHLDTLPEGSTERAAYLHSVSSNPTVIAQGM